MPSPHPQHPARLTKKQKKATAFRERGSKSKGKGKGKGPNPVPGRPRPSTTTGDYNGDDDDDEDANAVPVMEDQDQALAAMAGDTEGDAKGDKGRAARVPKAAVVASTAAQLSGKQKRRRAEDGEAQPGAKKARLARSSEAVLPPAAREGDGAASIDAPEGGDGGDGKNKESKAQRYILFIGNVLCLSSPLAELSGLRSSKGTSSTPQHPKQSRTTSPTAVRSLPSSLSKASLTHELPTYPDPPPTVRLLTPKATRAGTTAAKKSKSKGCAFLEFSTRPALQAALRLHQSELDGRRINVELTAGGGGKSDARLTKLKARNKLLAAQRVCPSSSFCLLQPLRG